MSLRIARAVAGPRSERRANSRTPWGHKTELSGSQVEQLEKALRLLEGASDESLFKGLQGLGLKLESRKAPLEVLVIDSASKTPSAN